ncbi:glycosyltransferase [Paenibacillus curdlanolyticus]|uniref:glycosyltransferase n=1 Tax=Paenibacillus curdlanolyticus TaxID=59840 RepID=UPI0003105B3A|nr:glycosyltransferase [Paenibacillus curdlanolyticus]
MKISVCMIVKNEQEQIERALASIPDHYEIIVIDTGSTDRTIEIALKYHAVVHRLEWKNHFAEARNFSISKATGEYIFILDADEEMDSDTQQNIERFIELHKGRAASVMIHNESETEPTRHRAVRLFPNNSNYKFAGSVHEQLTNQGKQVEYLNSSITIKHYGYLKQSYDDKKKFERYVKLYEESLRNNENDGYMLYQLGKLYYSTGKYREAYDPLMKAVNLQQLDKMYYPPLLVMFGYTLKELGMAKNAYEFVSSVSERYSQYPDLAFLKGILAMEAGFFDQIEPAYKKALEIGDTDIYTTVVGCGTYRAAHNLAVFYEVTNNLDSAKYWYSEAIRYDFEPSVKRLMELSKKTK